MDNGGAIEVEWCAADLSAFKPGAPHSGAHSLNDQVAFQLRDGTDNNDKGPAKRSAGVDVLTERNELDIDMGQFVQYF